MDEYTKQANEFINKTQYTEGLFECELTARSTPQDNGFYAIVDKLSNGHSFYEEIRTLDRAKRIALCCNSHDALVDALQATMNDISTALQLWQNGKLPEKFNYNSFTKAQNALNKARKM